MLLLSVGGIGLLVWSIGRILMAYGRPSQGPKSKLIGQIGRVVQEVDSHRAGKILVMGEIWDAIASGSLDDSLLPFEKDSMAQVIKIDAINPRVLVISPVLGDPLSGHAESD